MNIPSDDRCLFTMLIIEICESLVGVVPEVTAFPSLAIEARREESAISRKGKRTVNQRYASAILAMMKSLKTKLENHKLISWNMLLQLERKAESSRRKRECNKLRNLIAKEKTFRMNIES